MKFLTLAGNGRIKEQLSQRRELSHAYLISGPAGSGRHTLARLLAAALVCGIVGSFLGILSMLFPPVLTRFVPWGYYGLLALVRMDWNETTRVTKFFWQWPAPLDLVLLGVWALVFWTAGRNLFVRKEM